MSPSTAPRALQEGWGPIHALHCAMDRAVPCCSRTDLEHAGSQHAGQRRGPDMKAAILISPEQREASSLALILCFRNGCDSTC